MGFQYFKLSGREKYNFIRKGIEARLGLNIDDPYMIMKHISLIIQPNIQMLLSIRLEICIQQCCMVKPCAQDTQIVYIKFVI